MIDATLVMLASEIRGKTLRVLDIVTEEQARFTGHPGLNNSILWHAGHCVVTVERLCVVPALGTGQVAAYPAGWFETFGAGSQPATITAWPTLAEVTTLLRDQHDRLLGILKTLRQERMDQVIDPTNNRTLRYSILHGLHDEAQHQGEIQLLKKLWAKRGVVASATM
jgi:hypothetical protein